MVEYLYKSGNLSTSARLDETGRPLTDTYVKGIEGSSMLKGKVKSITTAGTRVQLDDIPCREVTVVARKGNTGSIFVGGNDVSSTNFGIELSANESFTFVVNNAKLIYIDSAVSGEGVSYVSI